MSRSQIAAVNSMEPNRTAKAIFRVPGRGRPQLLGKKLIVPLWAMVFVLLLLVSAGAQQYAPLDTPLKIMQVPGKPIYYSIGNPGVPAKANEGNTSNAGFVVTADGVLVFDALGTPSLGWALLQAIRKVTQHPVRYNVL